MTNILNFKLIKIKLYLLFFVFKVFFEVEVDVIYKKIKLTKIKNLVTI